MTGVYLRGVLCSTILEAPSCVFHVCRIAEILGKRCESRCVAQAEF